MKALPHSYSYLAQGQLYMYLRTILTCQKMYIYTHTHTKLTYFEHPNKNIDNPDLRITRRFNKNKNNVTLTTFLQ